MNRLGISLLYLLTCVSAFSQTDGGGAPVPPPAVPVSLLTFDPPQRTSLGGLEISRLANFVCAEDGTVFVQIADAPRAMTFVLHSLQGTTGDIRFDPARVPGYGPIPDARNFFVNDEKVAMLVTAPIEQNQLERQEANPTWVWLALIYNRKGIFERAVPIPSELDPKSVGIYGSGDLLVIAANKITKAAELYVLSLQGDVINHFLLFDEDYNTSKMAKKQQPFAEMTPDGALTSMQLVANGSNLLLVPQETSAPISEVNERGVVRTIQLKLPPGIILASLLSRNESLWKVRTNTGAGVTTDSKTGKTIGNVMLDGPVLEFNSFDGSLLRRIDRPKELNGMLACEHNGDYTAIGADPKDGRLVILTGTEVKK